MIMGKYRSVSSSAAKKLKNIACALMGDWDWKGKLIYTSFKYINSEGERISRHAKGKARLVFAGGLLVRWRMSLIWRGWDWFGLVIKKQNC